MSMEKLSGVLSKEEIELLSKSPLCLNCKHREIFHNTDEFGIECRVCECTEFIEEGQCSYWSVESAEARKTFDSICKPLESALARLLERTALEEFSKAKEFYIQDPREKELCEETGKVIRLLRHNRLKLPE